MTIMPIDPKPHTKRARPSTNLEHLIMRRMGHAIGDLNLIEPHDRVLVAVSGGKDSFALLHILDLHRRRSPFSFTLVPVFLDAGWDPEAAPRVRNAFKIHGFDIEIIQRDIRSNVESCLRPNTNPCALCSRLRRGVLYDVAPYKNCNKIALGHHLDDLLETLLLNLFFTGQIKSMAVNLRSDDGRNHVIRPLAYVEEDLIVKFVAERGFVPVKADCPYHAEGTDPRRAHMRKLLDQLSSSISPRIRRSMLAAMRHVRPSHLLPPFKNGKVRPR